MNNPLKQSTQVSVLIGPLLDSTTGENEEAIAYNAAGMDIDVYKGITKVDITPANSAGDGYWRHISNGCYGLTLSTSDTNTLGTLRVLVNVDGVHPCWEYFTVLSAQAYDALIAGTDKLQVDAVEISSSSTAADNVEANIGNLDASIAGLNDLSAEDVNAQVDAALADYDPPTKAEMDAALAALDLGGSSLTVGDIADAVWDEAQSGHTTVGTFGSYLDAKVSSVSGTSGSGADECTITIAEDGVGVPGATVWITTDAAGNTVVAEGKRTNDSGQVTLFLDDGSAYYLWAQCPAGFKDIHGQPFTAVAD